MHKQALPFILMVLLLGFPQVGETIYTPSLPDIAKKLLASESLTELTLGVFFLGFAAGVLTWGSLADKIGRRPAMLWGIFIYTLGSLGCCLSPTIYWLLGCRILQAFGASAGSVVTQTMLRDIYSGTDRSRIFAKIGAVLAISPAIGPILGGFVNELTGWQGNFLVLLTVGILLCLACWISLPETRPSTLPAGISLWKVGKKMFFDTHIWKFGLLVGAANGITFGYYAEAPFIFIDILGFSPTQYGMLGFFIAGAGMIASYCSYRLNRRYKAEEIIYGGSLCMLVGSVLLTANISMGLLESSFTLLKLLGTILPLSIIFIGIGILIPNCLSIALNQYKEVQGTAGSLFGFLYYLFIGIFTSLISFLHSGTGFTLTLYTLVLTIAIIMTARSLNKTMAIISLEN